MSMSTETAQPDTMAAVEAMSLEEIQAELRSYEPFILDVYPRRLRHETTGEGETGKSCAPTRCSA
jgi:hypothetical protein